MAPVSVLRWIAVLPGALLAATLVHLIFSAANALGVVNLLGNILNFPADPNVVMAQFVIGIIFGIAYAAAFVLSGAWIAPAKKATTRLVLAVLVVLLSGLSGTMVALGVSPIALLSESQLIATPCTGLYFLSKGVAWKSRELAIACGRLAICWTVRPNPSN